MSSKKAVQAQRRNPYSTLKNYEDILSHKGRFVKWFVSTTGMFSVSWTVRAVEGLSIIGRRLRKVSAFWTAPNARRGANRGNVLLNGEMEREFTMDNQKASCQNCQNRYYCPERSREYPCREYVKEGKA